VIRLDIRKGTKYAREWKKLHNKNLIIFSLHPIFHNDKSKRDQMGKSHSTYREMASGYKIMLGKSEIQRTLSGVRL
jgi:hypothetical protein